MKYKLLKSLGGGTKKGMIFEWDKNQHCYTTKSMIWFCTPLLERSELNLLIKKKYFTRLAQSPLIVN